MVEQLATLQQRASTQSLKDACLTTIFLESKYDNSVKSSVYVFQSYEVTIAAIPHTIVSMKMLTTPALHRQEVLVLLIIKILILSMVRNHDLVLSALYMKLHYYFKSNNDTSRFDIKKYVPKCLQTLLKWCSKMDVATMHISKCWI